MSTIIKKDFSARKKIGFHHPRDDSLIVFFSNWCDISISFVFVLQVSAS